jgi:hypothetical protein
MAFFVLISLVSGVFIVRAYRVATPFQRRQILLASGAAVTFAAVALLLFVLR